MNVQLTRHQRRAMKRHAKAADKAIEGDRRFFKHFPNRSYRVRLLSVAERTQIEALQGGAPGLQSEHFAAFVVLKQLAPGVRLRGVVFGPAAAIGEELTEEEARSVWEGYAAHHPEVSKREADMLAITHRPGGPLHNGGPTA